MSMFEPNNSGTVAFTNGSTTIAGVGTLLRNYRAGSVISIPGLGEMQLADDPDSDTAGAGIVAWQGQDTGPQAFQYIPRNEQAVLSQKLTALLLQLSNGNLQALAALAGASGLLPLFSGAGTMVTIPLASLSAGAVERVETPAGLAAFDDEASGFAVLIGDADGEGRGALRWKLSPASADWSEPLWFTGKQGPIGDVTPEVIAARDAAITAAGDAAGSATEAGTIASAVEDLASDTAAIASLTLGYKDDAQAAAAEATSNAALSVSAGLSVLIYNTDATGLARGEYLATLSSPSAVPIKRFSAAILSGAGAVTVTPLVNGLAIADPQLVVPGDGVTITDLDHLLAQGDAVAFAIDNVAGCTSLYAQLDGGL